MNGRDSHAIAHKSGESALTAALSVCQCSGNMNTLWFRNQLKDKHLSQRGLARLLDIDSAAVSLMLRGRRRMTMSEAHRISNILALPVTEIMLTDGRMAQDCAVTWASPVLWIKP